MKNWRLVQSAVAVALIAVGAGFLFSWPVAVLAVGVLVLIDSVT